MNINELILYPYLSFLFLFCSYSLLPTSPLPLQLPIPLLTPLLFLFRKGWASHGSQQNMAKKGAMRISTSLCIKVWQGDPV